MVFLGVGGWWKRWDFAFWGVLGLWVVVGGVDVGFSGGFG